MLSFLIWLPAAAGLIGALLPRRTGRRDPSGPLTLLAALASLGLAIALIADYHPGSAQLAHVTDVVWIADSSSGSPSRPCSGRSWRRTWRCSSSSST